MPDPNSPGIQKLRKNLGKQTRKSVMQKRQGPPQEQRKEASNETAQLFASSRPPAAFFDVLNEVRIYCICIDRGSFSLCISPALAARFNRPWPLTAMPLTIPPAIIFPWRSSISAIMDNTIPSPGTQSSGLSDASLFPAVMGQSLRQFN